MVENDPTVGKSLDFSMVFVLVLNTNVALVLFYLSNPPNMRIDEGPI
jgi:hypothetical protein